jgi:hypothetical protein
MTDTFFFAAANDVSDIEKMFCMTQKTFLIPEKMFSAGKIVIFLVETIIGVSQKHFSDAEPLF